MPSTADLHLRLRELGAERVDAIEAGLGHNALYMGALEHELATARAAYVGVAVTEIASLRATLSGRTVG